MPMDLDSLWQDRSALEAAAIARALRSTREELLAWYETACLPVFDREGDDWFHQHMIRREVISLRRALGLPPPEFRLQERREDTRHRVRKFRERRQAAAAGKSPSQPTAPRRTRDR